MIELFSFQLNFAELLLILACGLLIGMSKTGISGAGLVVVPVMAHIFGGKLSTGIVLPMLNPRQAKTELRSCSACGGASFKPYMLGVIITEEV